MEHKKEFPTAAGLVMARSAKRIAVKYGDLGLARAARDLQARALNAIKMRQSYLPDDTSASAKLPAEQKPIPEKTGDRVRPLTPSEMEAMVDRHQEQALAEAADRYKAKKGSSGHKSPASSRTAYPTASALVMARAMKRVAGKHGDLGLARRARDLLKQAMQAIKKRQSVLSDRDDEGVSAQPKFEKRVVTGPSNIDGGIARIVEMPDGSGRIEAWRPGKGWVQGGASPDEFIGAKPVSPALAARMGLPASER